MDLTAEITSQEGWKRTLKVTVPATEIETAFDQATKVYRQKAKIPGFRPGKAPEKLINERFGGAIHQDVLETVVPRAFEGALRQLTLNPIGNPVFSGLDLKRGVDLSFQVELEVRPDLPVNGYRGLKLKRLIYEVSDADVDGAIDRLRDEAATLVEVARPAREGDVVTCNLQKIYDRNNRVKKSQYDGVKLELREERARPEFLKGIVGMTVGEGKEIEVQYPADDNDPDLAGNTVLYRAWLQSVSQKFPPAADDEFARTVTGGKAENLEKLRDALRADIGHRAASASARDLRRQMRRAVVDANPIPVPEGFLGRYLDDVTKRVQESNPKVSPEQVRQQFAPMATEQFRWDYALYEIAKTEKIEIADTEVKEIINSWPPDAPEKPDPENIRNTLLENKVYEMILAAAEVEQVPYTAPSQSRIVKP